MKLADARGCSLADITEDSNELNLWIAYYQIHGWPQDRQDYRLAYVAWTVATSMGGGRHKVSDFVPDFDPKEEAPITDWRSMRDALKEMASGQQQYREGQLITQR